MHESVNFLGRYRGTFDILSGEIVNFNLEMFLKDPFVELTATEGGHDLKMMIPLYNVKFVVPLEVKKNSRVRKKPDPKKESIVTGPIKDVQKEPEPRDHIDVSGLPEQVQKDLRDMPL